MTDREIIQGLIARDNRVTEHFFYVKCRPLLTAVMRLVFSSPVEYDEVVSELYNYIMADDAAKLRRFQYRSSLCQWLKVVATRFFIRRRNDLTFQASDQLPCDKEPEDTAVDTARSITRRIDVSRLLALMDSPRYADVLQHLVLNDEEPRTYAASIGVSVDNLYNIKRRAIAAFTRIALKYYSYGR